MIQSLASQGLVTVRPGADDERLRSAELTRAGRAELEEMNRRSDELAEAILAPLSESQRERLSAFSPSADLTSFSDDPGRR